MASPAKSDNASVIASALLKLSRQSNSFVARQFRQPSLGYQLPETDYLARQSNQTPNHFVPGILVGLIKTKTFQTFRFSTSKDIPSRPHVGEAPNQKESAISVKAH